MVAGVSDDLRELVKAHRIARGWSGRTAAARGGTSNTTWSGYETDGKLTARVRLAVAKAFEWGTDWPESPPPMPADVSLLAVLEAQLQVQAVALVELMRRLTDVEAELAELRDANRTDQGDGGTRP